MSSDPKNKIISQYYIIKITINGNKYNTYGVNNTKYLEYLDNVAAS